MHIFAIRNPRPIVWHVVCFGMLSSLFAVAVSAQRFVIGDEVMPKSPDVSWTMKSESGEDVELQPSDIWLPWKVDRIEGSRAYFRFDGKDVYCRARQVIPLDQATDFFQNQIESKAGDAWLHKSMGQAFVFLGQPSDAIAHFGKAFELSPEDYSIQSWMGRAYVLLDDQDKAEACFRAVAGKEGFESEMRLYRGFGFFAKEKWERALEELDKSELETNYVLGLRSDCLIELQKYEEALGVLAKWIATDELDDLAYYKRGLYYYRTGDNEKTLADTSLSLRLNAKSVNALLLRGATLSRLSRFKLALMDFEEALSLDPNRLSLHQRRYETLAEMKRFPEAIEGVTKRLEMDGSFDWGYFQRSVYYGEIEQIPKAIADATKAIEIDPNYPDYHIQRAKFYAQTRQTKECLEDHDRAIELNPKNARYYYERGRVRIRLGRFEAGLTDMDIASEDMTDSLGLFYIRGTAYKDLGSYDLAVADLEKCLEIDEANPYVMREIAWLLATHPNEKSRDSLRALRWINKAMEEKVVAEYQGSGTEWTIAEFYSVQAAALASSEKFDAAIVAQKKAIELLNDDDEKETYDKRLKLYEGKKAYVYDGGQWFQDN